jgi:CheY-like chemotaxis protein
MTTRRLLYIEDVPENVKLIEHICRAFVPGLVVTSTPHGRSGIELARQDPPDLILLDLGLPDMTGDEVTIALRADPATREIPIIVLSGQADPEARNRSIAHGASAYVSKPYDITEFVGVVQRLLDARALREQ